MSTPVSHDPLVVNTQDGACWMRRAVTREGRGLYAVADAPACCPEYVMATLAELAEHGLASVAFALPMPVGPGPRVSELDRLRAQVAELLAERHSTNEWVDDAAEALRASKARIAELEALTPAAIQTCRKCGAGYTYGEPCSTCLFKARMAAESDGITRRIAPTQALRELLEDPHDNPLHHKHLVPRDLPEIAVPFAAESAVEPSGCRYCGIPARVHAQQWKASVGWHQWVLPTDAQIKARMLARRAARTGGAR
jgi:hypothetical protein